MVQNMKNQSVKELVYEGILNDILQGVYPPNAILNERMLIEKYEVSKTPVREALVQLCSEGILKNIPRFGYQLPVITPAEINDIIEYRMMLECAALEKTIKIITNDEIDALVNHATSAVKLSQQKDVTVHWETNMEFHIMLCSYCRNQFVEKALQDALKFCCRVATQYFNNTWEKKKLADSSGHKKLVEAIRSRNLELARELLIEDINCMRDEIM